MTDRELLFYIHGSLSNPVPAGACISINKEQWEQILEAILKQVGEK